MNPSFRPSRRLLLAAPAALGVAGLTHALSADAATGRATQLARWSGTGWSAGVHSGTTTASGALAFGRAVASSMVPDHTIGRMWHLDRASWTSPVVTLNLAATELVPSWIADTPAGSAVRISIRARSATGTWSQWFPLALWSADGAGARTSSSITRTSFPRASDAVARTATDTLKAASGVTFSAVQLKVDLLRRWGTTRNPRLRQLAVTASRAGSSSTAVSAPGLGVGKDLLVPAYSQMLHEGHYPGYDGGGEAWCSATSMAMVLDYWKVGPSTAETGWVAPRPHREPQVDHAARATYDAEFGGTGNWPFNVAYAGARGLTGFVARLRDLNQAEQFIAAGIPLVVSTAFTSSQLTGAGFGTPGHLMVLRGFDAKGNAIVNDPASRLVADNSLVRKTYDRAQFESAWGRTAGTTYVVHPVGRSLPAGW